MIDIKSNTDIIFLIIIISIPSLIGLFLLYKQYIMNYHKYSKNEISGYYKRTKFLKRNIVVYFDDYLFTKFVMKCKSKKELYKILTRYKTKEDFVFYFISISKDYENYIFNTDIITEDSKKYIKQKLLKTNRSKKTLKILNEKEL